MGKFDFTNPTPCFTCINASVYWGNIPLYWARFPKNKGKKIHVDHDANCLVADN